MKNDYVNAVLEMLATGLDTESVLTGLSRTLESRGHEKLYSSILHSVLRILKARSSIDVPVVTVKNTESIDSQVEKIEKFISELGTAGSEYQTKIDPSIIGGFIVEYNHQQIDLSYKTKLTKLYQSITR